MAAVAHISSAHVPRPALVRTGPVAGGARTTLPTAIYRRRRAMAVLMLVSVVAALALALALQGLLGVRRGGPVTASQRPKAPAGIYVVQPGDTFWAVAGRIQPGGDPRPLVAQMVAAHGSPVLLAGERLVLPVAG